VRHVIWIIIARNPTDNEHITSSAHCYCYPHKQQA
jgi:hypothetical protein